VRHRWCWVPGPRHIRPYYAPALVGWIGGPSLSVSVSFGHGVGWFPLAPREVYVPWYRHTPRYVRHVNVSNTIIVNNINVTNVYGRRGQRPRYTYGTGTIGNAVTAVQRDVFVRGGRVGSQREHLSERDLRQWRDDVRPSSIAPERQSIVAGQPRREAPPRAAFADNPKRQSADFRASRVAAEQIKRAQSTQRNIAPENRIALRESSHERVQSMRGQPTRQNEVRSEERRRPPVQALQGGSSERQSNQSGDNSVRRSRETFERRDSVQQDDSRRETRERPQVREQPREQQQFREQPREVREQPQIREQQQFREQRQFREPPRESRREVREAPVERRSAPQVERRSSPPPVERSEPRVERQHSNQGSNQSSQQSSSRRDSGGDGPRTSRDRPTRRPD
jgi:hypothetical protein